jgi:MFS superfamily sulfate permease-like transporter
VSRCYVRCREFACVLHIHSGDSGAEASVGVALLSVSLLVVVVLAVSVVVAVALAAVFIKRRRATHQRLNDSVTPQQCIEKDTVI